MAQRPEQLCGAVARCCLESLGFALLTRDLLAILHRFARARLLARGGIVLDEARVDGIDEQAAQDGMAALALEELFRPGRCTGASPNEQLYAARRSH